MIIFYNLDSFFRVEIWLFFADFPLKENNGIIIRIIIITAKIIRTYVFDISPSGFSLSLGKIGFEVVVVGAEMVDTAVDIYVLYVLVDVEVVLCEIVEFINTLTFKV